MIINLSPKQLRRAAQIKEQIEKLQNELGKLVGSSVTPDEAKPAKKKGKMSKAGRARIAAAQKLRWAKINAAKKKK